MGRSIKKGPFVQDVYKRQVQSSGQRLLCLLNDTDQAPAHILAQGAALHDLNTVTDTALVLLVTSLELHGTLQDLLAVSYTHLDVYKRQALRRTSGQLRSGRLPGAYRPALLHF